jgi:hypothetical protein
MGFSLIDGYAALYTPVLAVVSSIELNRFLGVTSDLVDVR